MRVIGIATDQPFFMLLTIKEIMQLLDCSEKTAITHMKAIRTSQNTKFITRWHMADYLCIDFYAMEASYQARIKGNFEYAAKLIETRRTGRSQSTGHIITGLELFNEFDQP